jgi:hypothetical protein
LRRLKARLAGRDLPDQCRLGVATLVHLGETSAAA